MSDTETQSPIRRAYRTVTPGSKMHTDSEMNAIGWTMFLVLVALLVPLLPIIAAVWVVTKLIDYAATLGGDTEE